MTTALALPMWIKKIWMGMESEIFVRKISMEMDFSMQKTIVRGHGMWSKWIWMAMGLGISVMWISTTMVLPMKLTIVQAVWVEISPNWIWTAIESETFVILI